MVELTLPKNSRMTVGKTWPKPEGATQLKVPLFVNIKNNKNLANN